MGRDEERQSYENLSHYCDGYQDGLEAASMGVASEVNAGDFDILKRGLTAGKKLELEYDATEVVRP